MSQRITRNSACNQKKQNRKKNFNFAFPIRKRANGNIIYGLFSSGVSKAAARQKAVLFIANLATRSKEGGTHA